MFSMENFILTKQGDYKIVVQCSSGLDQMCLEELANGPWTIVN